MADTKSSTGTRIEEIEEGIYRVNTPFTQLPGGFSFNQYLVVDEEPLLFHTGPKNLFAEVRDAVARVLPPEKVRHIAFSHHESDENGSLEDWLDVAPRARAVCSRVSAMVGNPDLGKGREVLGMGDGETICTGRRTLRWIEAPHVPHGWDCGFLTEVKARVLFCGDLLSQPGARSGSHDRERHPRSERGVPVPHGLLGARAQHAFNAREDGGDGAATARLHARLGVARGRGAPAPRARGRAGGVTWYPLGGDERRGRRRGSRGADREGR
jgi:hypothetical protein